MPKSLAVSDIFRTFDLLHVTRTLSIPEQYQPLQVAAAYAPALENPSIVQDNLPTQIIINYSTENTDNVEFGAKHNVIVRNLQSNNFALDSDVKKLLTIEGVEILTSDDFIAEYNGIVNNLSSCIINGEVPQSDDKEISSLLMNLFVNILETYSDKVEDIEFIINKYVDAIQSTSELSEDEKDNIYKSLSVAASSYEFWNEK